MATKKAIYKYDNGGSWDEIMFKTTADMVVEDSTRRFVSDAEKTVWNGKANASHTHNYAGSSSAGGSANTAVKLANARTITASGDATGSTSFDGSANVSLALALVNSGVTSGSYGPTANTTASFGGTFTVPQITVDAKGRVTSATSRTITMPSNPNTDTKVTNTLATTTKAYITGTTSATTNTGTQVFDTGVYLDSTAGKLVAKTFAGDLQGNASTATTLQNTRTINGTNFNGSANITTANWGTSRTLTIGNSGKSVNGSGNVSWTLSEIGAAASSHSHSVATASANGFMSALDKKKFDGLQKLLVSVSTFDELKSAISASSSQPTTIFVTAGTYNFSETLYVPSYTRLIGVGEVIFQSNNDSVNCYICNKSDGVTGGHNAAYDIVVENITFDGLNRTSALTPLCFGHASHIQIIDCTFRNLHVWHLLELNAVSNAMVYNCAFDNYGNTGSAFTEAIQLDGAVAGGPFPWFGPYDNTCCEDIEFNSCRFTNIGGKCLGNHTFVEGMVTKNVKFINNTINKASTVIALSDIQGLYCYGNYAEDCNFFIHIGNQKNDMYDIIVDGNIFYGRFKGSPINETEGRFIGVNISGNGTGKKCKRMIISNNSINDIWYHGIGFTMDDVIITNNIFRRIWKNGIYVFGCWTAMISGNTFYETAFETDSRGGIVIGNNSAAATQFIMINGNNVQNKGRIIAGSNVNRSVISNNIGTVVDNSSGGITATNNLEM